MLLSDDFARRLKVKPGDKVTLVSSTMNGSVATWNFILSGTVRFGVTAMDRGMMICDIRDIQKALDMPDAADMVLGFLPRGQYDDKLSSRLVAKFNAAHPDEDQYAPQMATMRTASGLGSMFKLLESTMAVSMFVFVLAMTIVLWNAGLMGSLRRYGEIGVRLAIGESKHAVYRSLLAEAFLVGLVGSALGTAIGIGFSYYLQQVGFDVGSMMRNATMVIDDIIRARIAPSSFIVGFLPGLLATFLGAAISGLGIYKRQTAMLAKELGN